jgi:DNA-binding MarR family transcriptional regulator
VLPRIEHAGLAQQEFELLIRLARTPGGRLRMAELAGVMTSITPSGLTRLVDRLETRDLVARERCPDDRRGAFAVITEVGLASVRVLLPGHVADLEQHLTGLLDDDERATLVTLLRRIRDASS